jgi:hypothetical protein
MKLRICVIEVALLAAEGMWGQSPVPKASELHDPPGQSVLFRLQTLPTSVQIYTCKASTDPVKPFAWSGPDPDAIIANSVKTVTLHHYKGPTWEGTDGSMVVGSNAKHFLAPREKSVDWLELTATNGTGQFAKVAFIHRLETSGGVPPSQPCDTSHNLEQVRVPYSATYLFYVPKY